MEFREICGAPISMTRLVPWNSMEFHGTWSGPISLRRAVPWNSMEFHGTSSALISMTRAFSWNSIELWNAPISMAWAVPLISMELGVSQFRWPKYSNHDFHGIRFSMEFLWIPRKMKCANFDDTGSSMGFHGTSIVNKYINIKVRRILVEFEACIIPAEID